MCGFAGIYRWDGARISQGQIKAMADTLSHRGPDDESYFLTQESQVNVGMGFRRLSIIDLAGGRQPMTTREERCRIVFNGEIYNFPELRKDLEKRGRRLSTRSDTEVILHLYEIYGADCVQHLRGMFSFAIWDGKYKSLFLARDRVGKKPLFYALKGKSIVFGSEMKAVLASGEIEKKIRMESIPLYLAYQFIPDPRTIFEGIFRLPPGHTLTCDARGDIRINQYWILQQTPKHRMDLEELKTETVNQLREATKIRLISDVPLGAFLSGGIDSTAVVGFMAEEMSKPVKTFSIGFEEHDFSELNYARMAADHFRTDHSEFIVKPETIEILPKLVWHYDQPFADPSALPSYYVARETRKHVTVALNGDGGDENFGGYLRYQADRVFLAFSRAPRGLRRLASAVLEKTLPAFSSNRFLRRAVRAASIMGFDPLEFNFRLFCYFDQESLLDLAEGPLLSHVKEKNVYNYFSALYADTDSDDIMDRILSCDIHGYLPGCLLVKMDIASMANSLEARSPFLDPKVMEFAARIRSQDKVKMTGGKWILKEALKGFLPESILKRRKMGFGVPLAKWLRGPLKGYLRETLLGAKARGRGYFKMDNIEWMIDHHEAGTRDPSYKLWALLMFELWHRVWMDGDLKP